MSDHDDLKRFTYAERVIHWVAGLSFLFLLMTGLAFSHPRLF
jgi:cytochrome b subunit of formate dehydrogenase